MSDPSKRRRGHVDRMYPRRSGRDPREQRAKNTRRGDIAAAAMRRYALEKDDVPFQVSMLEAVLLKRAAWDGPTPEPGSLEEKALTGVLERIEAENERRRADHEKRGKKPEAEP